MASAILNFVPWTIPKSAASPSIFALPILDRSMNARSQSPKSQGTICRSNFLVMRVSSSGGIGRSGVVGTGIGVGSWELVSSSSCASMAFSGICSVLGGLEGVSGVRMVMLRWLEGGKVDGGEVGDVIEVSDFLEQELYHMRNTFLLFPNT